MTFNTDADTKIGLTLVNDQGRQILIDKLPTQTGGRTSIGSGMLTDPHTC